MAKFRRGQKFGDWRLKNPLGAGGNGQVWLAENTRGENAAIKILANFEGKNKEKVYARFISEVRVFQKNGDIEGLLPIIGFYLPNEIGDEFPWYVMPVAKPLTEYLKDTTNFEIAVQVIIEVGKILAKLHGRGITHRDIKPANILVWDGKVCLADFGLVDYPEKSDLTSTGEQLGAKWTIAPEMRRDSTRADGKSADVYSLAKTLWILLTGNKFGFDGQYDPVSVNGLNRIKLTEPGADFFFEDAPLIYIEPLDNLLRASTDNDPQLRPTMSQFVEQLSLWSNIYSDLRKRNPLQWQDVQTRLFPTVLPQRAIWENTGSIVEILNYLGSIDHLNHILLPDGGFMDLRGANRGIESDTIELLISRTTVYVVKPKRLIFESFDFDWEWNYFLLETSELEATGIGNVHKSFEYLLEIGPLQYVSEADWERDRDEKRRYPAEYRRIFRYVKGDFLILQRSSMYARSQCTDDGRHNQMGSDIFRTYISNKVELVRQMLQNPRFAKSLAERREIVSEVIFDYLNNIFREESLSIRRRKRLTSQRPTSDSGEEE